MKRATLALLLLIVPLQVSALETQELLGLVAMPLAVAAVSEVTGVPPADLGHLVATLNRAEVPPTQVVQVVRYAPAALVIEERRPAFVQYVDQQASQGVVGTRLVSVIEDRYRTYELEPRFVTLEEPATTYVIRDDYIPPVVVSQLAAVRPLSFGADTNDLLSLIAMPLAVAAASELTGIPTTDLAMLVQSLNAADVEPVQFVEVLRYAPVALLVNDPDEPRFVQFVDSQVDSGLRGPALVELIDRRLRTYDVDPDFTLAERRPVRIIDDEAFFPPVVRTRIAEARAHPHGGPPGQLKKERGLQTGAEVVHGIRAPQERRVRAARADTDDRKVQSARDARREVRENRPVRSETRNDVTRERPRAKPAKTVRKNADEKPRPASVSDNRSDNSRNDNARSNGNKKGNGNSSNKGNGKGKGKG